MTHCSGQFQQWHIPPTQNPSALQVQDLTTELAAAEDSAQRETQKSNAAA